MVQQSSGATRAGTYGEITAFSAVLDPSSARVVVGGAMFNAFIMAHDLFLPSARLNNVQRLHDPLGRTTCDELCGQGAAASTTLTVSFLLRPTPEVRAIVIEVSFWKRNDCGHAKPSLLEPEKLRWTRRTWIPRARAAQPRRARPPRPRRQRPRRAGGAGWGWR